MQKLYLERKQQGLCVSCGEPSKDGTVYCEKHLEQRREYQKKYREKRKENGHCLWCGCNEKPEDGRAYCQFHIMKLRVIQPEKYRCGMSDEAIQKIFDAQNHKCKICKMKTEVHNELCVDHCHKTGKVRGLLCRQCNAGLGNFRDNTELLKSAIKYLGKKP